MDDGPGELLLRLRELDVIEERLPENELQLLTVNGALTLEKKIKIETIKIDGIMNLFLNSCVYICLDFLSLSN